jgi:hypothetical protein
MPAAVPPPLTSRQAKRLHQKSGKGFQFTASQERAAARRNQKDEQARKLREKEERAKTNKRKREEKEEKERASKRRLIEKGRLPEDSLLPKVSASQPRLSSFMRQPASPVFAPLPPPPPRGDDEEDTVKGDSENEEDTLVDDQRLNVELPAMDEAELEEFLSTAPTSKEELVEKHHPKSTKDTIQRPTVNPVIKTPPPATADMERSDLEARLGCPLSQAMLDFEICEDPLSESEQALIITPSPRKRKRDQVDFATPSKSARSALSEMSPAKVLLRSQERPDTTSVPSIAARMMSPEPQWPTPCQLAQETIAMISTQDFDDEIDFSQEKENADPGHALSSQQRNSVAGKNKLVLQTTVAGPSNSTSRMKNDAVDEYDFDDSVFEGFMDVEKATESDELKDLEEVDEFDGGLDDADWAGLSTQKPKNTAVSTFGSPKKAKDLSAKTSTKSMAPPPRLSPVVMLVQKLRQVTPKKVQAPIEHEAPLASQNYSFDEDLEADMIALVDEVDSTSPSAAKKTKKVRTLPWTNRPANWDAQMAAGDRDEGPDSASQCDA